MILCIETATSHCSAALGWGEELLASRSVSAPEGGHAAALAPMVQELLSLAKAEGKQLRAIAVSAGPGSYTGLRISTSLAKGLCLGMQLPLIAVDTLAILTAGARRLRPETQATLHPMLDARRMEVYTATFDAAGARLSEDSALVLEAEQSLATEGEHLFFGDGALKVKGLWREGHYELLEELLYPEAKDMVALATELYEAEAFVDTAYWTPNYLKEYVAVVAKNKVLQR